MKTFNDTTGRQWNVSMNVSALKRVRDLLDIDLMQLPVFDQKQPETGLLYRLGNDPVELVNVLFALVKPQADAAGVSDEAFGEALGGDALGEATEAFMAEVVGFFPRGVRDALLTVMEKAKTVEGMMLDQLATAINDPALDEAIKEAAGIASGDAGASSGSTPAR
ncbi:MAG: hypothetical protein AAGG38_06350 [Planctomycetota bacterium]